MISIYLLLVLLVHQSRMPAIQGVPWITTQVTFMLTYAWRGIRIKVSEKKTKQS